MKYLGKRSDRLRMPRQLGTDPELGAIIRSRAERMGRNIDVQILHLLEVGLDHDPEYVGNARRREDMHASAQGSTSTFAEEQAKHAGAQPRTAPHANTLKRHASA